MPTDIRMLVLFAITVPAFFAVPMSWRHAVLIVSGIAFYAWAAPSFLPVAAGMIALTYVVSGRTGVWAQLAVFVGLMLWFKLHGTIMTLLTPDDVQVAAGALGLSFLVFELLHVSIERARGRIPRLSLSSLAAFALYFPCRTAGPIKRYPAFEASVRRARWSVEQTYHGLVRMVWGFFKKIVLADTLRLFIPPLLIGQSAASAWGALVFYGLFLFLDFSAYSDVAIGMSRCLGLQVPENFRWPYLSRNIREFWSRWHMSLTSWLTDYIYLPLSRRLARPPVSLAPRTAATIGILATFALCGLWHGLKLNFLCWGLYHGALLAVYAWYASGRAARPRAQARSGRLAQATAWALTYASVTIGWAVFAMPLADGLALIRRAIGWNG